MPYVCSVERIGIEKGLVQGLEQGLEQGREQGIEKGMQQGQVRVLARLLSHRFGEVPAWVTQRLNIASVDELEAWAEAVLTADSIDAVLKAARH